MKKIEKIIENIDEKKEVKIDWTNTWGKKYPILLNYQKEVDIDKYALKLREMLNSLKQEYGMNDLDSMLVLKDILYHEWKDNQH